MWVYTFLAVSPSDSSSVPVLPVAAEIVFTALLYSSPREMSSAPADTTAAPIAVTAAPNAAPMPPAILPRLSSLPPESSAASPASSRDSVSVSTFSSASPKAVDISRIACSLASSSFSMPFSAALALFSCICQFCVRLSFSPNDSEAFCRAFSRVSIFCFCASMDLSKVSFLAVSASTDLSCLSNCDATSSISDPRTLKD